jgi:hypothetical protein
MVHHGQRLALGFEASDDGLGIHAQLDDFERDPSPNRFGLLGDIDHATASFANSLEQLITANALAHGFVLDIRQFELQSWTECWRCLIERSLGLLMSRQEGLQAMTQGWVVAGLIQKDLAHRACWQLGGSAK